LIAIIHAAKEQQDRSKVRKKNNEMISKKEERVREDNSKLTSS